MSDNPGEPGRLRAHNEALRQRVAALEIEARLLKATLYSIGDAVIATDASSVIVQMNPVAEALTGWSEAEARGRPAAAVFTIVNEETGAEVESPVTRVLREGMVVGLANHTVLVARDGTRRPIADTGAPIRDEDGQVMGVVLVFRDQTHERAVQQALADSEHRFRNTLKHLDEGYYSVAVEGLLLDHNLAFNRILGFDDAVDLKGQPSPNFWQDPDDRREYLTRLMGEGFVANYQANAKTIHGDSIVVLLHSHLVRGEQGQILRIEGTVTDYTERQRTEEALSLSEEKYRGLFDNAEVGMYRSRLDGSGIIALNQRLADIFGFTKEEVLSTPATLRWADPPAREEMVRALRERGELRDHELDIVTSGGKIRTVLASMKLYPREGYLEGTAIDITEGRQAAEALREANSNLEQRAAELKESQDALVEAQTVARVGSWEWNIVEDVISGSAEFYRLFDVAPEQIVRYVQFVERLDPDGRERVQRDVADALQQDRPYDTDYRARLRNGDWRDINARGRAFVDEQGRVLRFVGTCMDITERKAAEAELRIKNQVFEDSIASQSVADKNGVITHVNTAFMRMWGYATKAEATGKSVGSFFANPADATPVLEALAAHDAWEGRFLAARTDGSIFVSHGYATSLRSAAGKLTGYQSTNLDMTPIRDLTAPCREKPCCKPLLQATRASPVVTSRLPITPSAPATRSSCSSRPFE